MKNLILVLAFIHLSTESFCQSNVTTGDIQYVLVENATGAWCQYCPDGAVRLEGILNAYPKTIGSAMHNRDSMEIPDGATVNETYVGQYGGYPFGMVNRMPGWKTQMIAMDRGDWLIATTELLPMAPTFEVSMAHSFNAATGMIDITVTAKSLLAQTGNYNINVFVIEDSVIGPNIRGYVQSNTAYNAEPGHPYYQKGDPILNYVHRHVLRAMLGGPWGSSGAITNNPPAGGTYQRSFSYTIPSGRDYRKYRLIGLVQKNSTSINDRPIINAIKAIVTPGTTGISQPREALLDVEIFPNPAMDNVAIKGILDKPGDMNVTIINSAGAIVFEKDYHYKASMFGEAISLTQLSSGVYFIRLNAGEREVVTRKLIVNRN